MTTPLTPQQAIRFALQLLDAQPSPELVVRALELAGYAIVPKEAAAAGAAAPGAPPPKPPPVPKRGPVICRVCSKVRNNGGDDECDRTDCPF